MSISSTGLDTGLLRSFENNLLRHGTPTIKRFAANSGSILEASHSQELAMIDSAQRSLRPLFGKGAPVRPSIGDHPDFMHLKGTDDVCYCPITTMFMDIEGSTRLSLLYDLETVRAIKNAFIQSAIQIVQSFDGHVHRIMGDAVMAFFGGTTSTNESSTINGINAAAVLQHFAEKVVRPRLDEIGCDHDFGIRIGLDFGQKENVLWSTYGYPGVEEVTATSFYVDVAAKLQHAAGRNQAMFGASIVSEIDFPECLVGVKTVQKNGSVVDVPFIQPNHTDRDGKPANYRQQFLRSADYLACTPIAHSSGDYPILGKQPLSVTAEEYSSDKSYRFGTYEACSRALPKNRKLKFQIQLPYMPMLPYTVTFTVENNGSEAWSKNPEDGGNHSSVHEIRTQNQHYNTFAHWESTEYRGLHFMTIEVKTHHGVQYRTKFGVYVE